jgi:hypothetical protein
VKSNIILYIVCFKARQLFPPFESGLQATVISICIRYEKYGSRLFNYALPALEKNPCLILHFLSAYRHAKHVIFSKK